MVVQDIQGYIRGESVSRAIRRVRNEYVRGGRGQDRDGDSEREISREGVVVDRRRSKNSISSCGARAQHLMKLPTMSVGIPYGSRRMVNEKQQLMKPSSLGGGIWSLNRAGVIAPDVGSSGR